MEKLKSSNVYLPMVQTSVKIVVFVVIRLSAGEFNTKWISRRDSLGIENIIPSLAKCERLSVFYFSCRLPSTQDVPWYISRDSYTRCCMQRYTQYAGIHIAE